MITATKKNVEWLIERLYVARRHLNSWSALRDPAFVLLTKNMEDRRAVEEMFYRYFNERYAIPMAYIQADMETADLTRIASLHNSPGHRE